MPAHATGQGADRRRAKSGGRRRDDGDIGYHDDWLRPLSLQLPRDRCRVVRMRRAGYRDTTPPAGTWPWPVTPGTPPAGRTRSAPRTGPGTPPVPERAAAGPGPARPGSQGENATVTIGRSFRALTTQAELLPGLLEAGDDLPPEERAAVLRRTG